MMAKKSAGRLVRKAKKPAKKANGPSRHRRALKRKAASKKHAGDKNIKPREVEALLEELQSEERAEKSLASIEVSKPSVEEEQWAKVEEDLTEAAVSENLSQKRWKFYAK